MAKGKKKVSVKAELLNDSDYLESGSKAQEDVLKEMAEESDRKGDIGKVIQFGETPWRLVTAVRDMVDNRVSLVHGMEIGKDVLVRFIETKGNGGISVSSQLLVECKMVWDKVDSDLNKIIKR